MSKAYDPSARIDTMQVKYKVNTTGDRWFIPYNDNGTTAAQVATKDTLTGSKWGDFALNTATNLGTSVATGYALNKLTEGDPTGVPTGLAYEGETRLDPLQIYSGGQALSVDGIYQNMMYGTGDPFYQASTELYKQQTIGVPA